MQSTPRLGHPPIDMRRLPKDGFWDRDDVRAGDFYWSTDADGRRRIWIMIPCQRRGQVANGIPVMHPRGVASEWTIDHKNECGAQWGFDGNEEKPTLSPSLHAIGVWHGWVRNGQLIEA